MIKCIAIYPHEITPEYTEQVKNTIELAVKYGFNEIFTTVHLPEYSLNTQLETLYIISNYAKKHDLEVTVDIGGHFIDEVLRDDQILNKFKQIKFDFVRLDYGYDINQAKNLYDELDFKGFVVNASIYNEKEIDSIVRSLKKIDKDIEIRACHNYYVRNESGLDPVFALRQDSYFSKYNIPIYYCVPSHLNPRGPLHEGLCTIESHRNASIPEIITDLYINYNLTAFMMADEWLSENEYLQVQKTLDYLTMPLNPVEKIKVVFMESVSKQEKEIVLKKHQFRFDSNFHFLRSQSSRQMAEFADSIKKNITTNRKAGYITVDNELYKRYSGEMQVVMRNNIVDERVNVVARVADIYDLIKLARFREGIEYIFEE